MLLDSASETFVGAAKVQRSLSVLFAAVDKNNPAQVQTLFRFLIQTKALGLQLLAERVVSFSKQGRDQLRSAIATLLQQEFALVVAADEVDEVLDQIDDLRADTDKLEARLSKLIMASKP